VVVNLWGCIALSSKSEGLAFRFRNLLIRDTDTGTGTDTDTESETEIPSSCTEQRSCSLIATIPVESSASNRNAHSAAR
jgi:hypothetical protein